MARIRSIHPGLTSDEAYMSMSMTAKAAWTPLWMQCDDHGIFEWKPIVLKAIIFPADNVKFDEVLLELEQLGCVMRIEIAGKPCGIVRNFARYQRPKNPSYRYFRDTPIPVEYGKYIGLKDAATPVLPQPTPSPTEIPPQRKEEGGKREEIEKKALEPVAKPQPRASADFLAFKAAFPKRDGAQPWAPAEKKFNALVKTGVDPQVMVRAASALAREEASRGNAGTKFIPQAITWLNQQRFIDYAADTFVAEARPTRYYAAFDSPQLDAWDRHNRATTGKLLPRDHRGGWHVDTEWPPGHTPLETASLDAPSLALRSMQ